MDGWIKLHRKLLTSKVWHCMDAEGKVILITMLLRASHSITRWQITASKTAALNPGELFITYRTFAVKCGVSTKKLGTVLQQLAGLEFLTMRKNKDGTIISICNWYSYQTPETPLETPLETPAETPEKQDTDCGSGTNTDFVETQVETTSGTPLETHNKIYILIKNKYNKTELNNSMLADVELNIEFRRGIKLFQDSFPDKALKPEERYNLQVIAAMLGGEWILRSAYELKAISREKQIKNPSRYWIGILQNWLTNGIPNDSKGKNQELNDFYQGVGVWE